MHAGKGNFSFISFNDSIYCLFATKPTYPCTSVFPGTGTVLGAMWPRTHSFMSGAERIPHLAKVAKDKGVTIYTETKGTEILVDSSGKVVGAKAEQTDGTQITINTKNGVILATGGYCANPKMVKEYDQYWGDDLSDRTLSTNMGTNEGDGIIMAQAIGADVTGMEVAQMMPSSSPVKGTMTDGIWADAAEQIWIDGNGNRFVNEYAERDVLAKSSLALEDGIFYIIYAGRGDVGNPNQLLKGTDYNERVAGMVEGGHIWYGETLAELAEATKTKAAGVAPAFTEEQLRATIEKYNSYVANQKDDEFGKEVLAGAIDIDYIDATEGVGNNNRPHRGLITLKAKANSQGAWNIGFRTPGEEIRKALLNNELKGLVVIGEDILGNVPELKKAADNLKFFAAFDIMENETTSNAEYVLPLCSIAESNGTIVSADGTVRNVYQAIKPLTGTSNLEMFAKLAGLLNAEYKEDAKDEAKVKLYVPTLKGKEKEYEVYDTVEKAFLAKLKENCIKAV
jgi:hypothetical protein